MSRLLLILGVCLTIAFFGVFVWQQSKKSTREDDADKHTEIATTMEGAVADGLATGTVLTEYVQTGNPALLATMQAKSDEAVGKLTAAVTNAGSDPNGFVKTGSVIVQRSGEVIALRQAGDAAGASAALQALGNDFGGFVQQQRAFVAEERQAADSSKASADDANQLSILFMVAGMVTTLAIAGATAVRLFRRKPAVPLPA